MSKCPLLIATPNHWVVDCYGEKCAWFHSVCKQPQKAKTNADRIRSMTDEELANMWYTYVDCGECPKRIGCSMNYQDCLRLALEWLRQEAT